MKAVTKTVEVTYFINPYDRLILLYDEEEVYASEGDYVVLGPNGLEVHDEAEFERLYTAVDTREKIECPACGELV